MINEEEETADKAQIQVSFPCDKDLEVQDEAVRFMPGLRFWWPVILVTALIVILGATAASVLVSQNNKYHVAVELLHYAEVAVKDLTKQLQFQDTQLKQVMQSMHRKLTHLKNANNKLKVLMNMTLFNITLLRGENTKLRVFLKDVLHIKKKKHSCILQT